MQDLPQKIHGVTMQMNSTRIEKVSSRKCPCH